METKKIRVGVNGYGTVGRRVADAILKQPDMELVGIAKLNPDYKAKAARKKGIEIFLVDESVAKDFQEKGISVSGSLIDLLKKVDIIVDATPGGKGAFYKDIYSKYNVKSVFQGGEKHSLTGLSFLGEYNFSEAAGKDSVRVLSCNTTGISRLLWPLDGSIGVKKTRAVIARRAFDPEENGNGPIDSVVLDPVGIPSHHADDVKSLLPKADIITMAYKVPTTHMHLHSLLFTMNRATTKEEVISVLKRQSRVSLVDSRDRIKSTSSLIEYAREIGRPRNDIYEVVVWEDSIKVDGDEVYLYAAINQEAIVVPENIDAIRALSGKYTKQYSIETTNKTLGIPGW